MLLRRPNPAGQPRRTRRWCRTSWRGCGGRSCQISRKRKRQSHRGSPLLHNINEMLAPIWYPVEMDQGPSKEKKRHHFIPITYLKEFSDNIGKIFAYRKDNPQTALYLRPDAIAFETYYYSQPLPDGGRDNNTFENFFGTLESTWNPL